LTPGDATNDAAGETLLFEQLFIKGITDVAVPAQGMAWIDLNRDGKLCLLTLQREPKSCSHEAIAHFGLGNHTAVKVRMVLPDRTQRAALRRNDR
jgi:hypothetical protein